MVRNKVNHCVHAWNLKSDQDRDENFKDEILNSIEEISSQHDSSIKYIALFVGRPREVDTDKLSPGVSVFASKILDSLIPNIDCAIIYVKYRDGGFITGQKADSFRETLKTEPKLCIHDASVFLNIRKRSEGSDQVQNFKTH